MDDRACAIVPSFNAAATLGGVLTELKESLAVPIIVVDDGSTDATHDVARAHASVALRHERNRGKGAAIRTGLLEAARQGFRTAVTVDADGQHPASSARMVLDASDDARALVLGVRNLVRDGAPVSNRVGNAVANFFLSRFAGRALRDTQCGLRRYPVSETLELGCRADGYAYEGEVLLRAIRAGLPVVEITVTAVYSASREGQTHFHRVLDPTRIVATVVRTVLELGIRG